MNWGLTFDDVALVPKYNNVDSRLEPCLWTELTRHMRIQIPIVAANMDTVIGPELANVLTDFGSTTIFHRYAPIEEQVKFLEEFGGFFSIGLDPDLKSVDKLLSASSAVCIDVAHGHSNRVIELIKTLRSMSAAEIIAGNVCTGRGYRDLAEAGVDAVKVGIGPGAACTTRTVTGFGVPQFTAIRECAKEANKISEKFRVPIIADGGIRSSGDVVKALAAGASSVMIGKLFALTEESAAEKRGGDIPKEYLDIAVESTFIYDPNPRPREAKYRGQASGEFQREYFGQTKTGTVPEGDSFWAPISETAIGVIERLLGGIRSGMTYGGARDILELQRKAEFMRVAPSYLHESGVRP